MVIIDVKKEVKTTKKKWYMSRPQTEFSVCDNKWIAFLEKSGERDCECKNARPMLITEILADGDRVDKIRCSICGGKFYKTADFSFVMLILGRKGGGKTTFVFTFVDLIHTIDGFRKIKLWQCPERLIKVLHNLKLCGYYKNVCERLKGEMKWNRANPMWKNPDQPNPLNDDNKPKMFPFQENEESHCVCKFTDYTTSKDCMRCKYFQLGKNYYERCERLDQVEFNDVIVLDEGIISVNAKEALSKKMRMWDKFLAVVRQKRVILFVLFQRFEVIKSLREMSDMILYKSLPAKLIENEKDDQIIKNHGDKIKSLKKWEAIIASDHNDFDALGMVTNKVPYWYTDDVSMSYIGDSNFLSDKEETKKDIDRAEELAQWLIDTGHIIEKPADVKGARFDLRKQFNDSTPALTNAQISLAMEAYFSMHKSGEGEDSEVSSEIVDNSENMVFFDQLKQSNISKLDLQMFEEYANGTSVTDFDKPPYNCKKQQASEICRKVGQYLLHLAKSGTPKTSKKGDDAERRVIREAWESNGYAVRVIGSGGEHQGIPNPDCLEITQDGKLRPIQVKERNPDDKGTYSPLTFNNEFKIINRIRTIAQNTSVKCKHCGEKINGIILPDSAYAYITSKDPKFPFIKEQLEYSDNKKTLAINWELREISRQSPDTSKIKSPKMKEFLESKSNIYWGNEDLEKEEEQVNEKEQEDIINFDKLLEDSGIAK